MRSKIASMLPLLVFSMVISIWAQNGPAQAGKFQNGNGTCLTCTGTATQPLTNAEKEDLILIRQDEKLARDVYLYLFDRWGVLVFDNIAKSEQRHFDAVATLLERYGVEDPVTDKTPGIFDNLNFADFYSQLTGKGSLSLADAMTVGAFIEELDIYDLRAALDETERADITNVYSNLLLGSMNHLRSFVSHLQILGVVSYTAQVLDQADVDAILSATGPGKGRR